MHKPFLPRSIALLLPVIAAACTSAVPAVCTANADCGAGSVCVNSECVPSASGALSFNPASVEVVAFVNTVPDPVQVVLASGSSVALSYSISCSSGVTVSPSHGTVSSSWGATLTLQATSQSVAGVITSNCLATADGDSSNSAQLQFLIVAEPNGPGGGSGGGSAGGSGGGSAGGSGGGAAGGSGGGAAGGSGGGSAGGSGGGSAGGSGGGSAGGSGGGAAGGTGGGSAGGSGGGSAGGSGGGSGGGSAGGSGGGSSGGSAGGSGGGAAGGAGGGVGTLSCTAPDTFNTSNGSSCGSWRWSIKTGQDSAAAAVVRQVPTPIDIKTLGAFPVPTGLGTGLQRTAQENTLYILRNVVVVETKLESDSDYHMPITDPVTGAHMEAEIPFPKCTNSAVATSCSVTHPRHVLESIVMPTGSYQQINKTATIIGPALFDMLHGSANAAPNGIEIHPVLALCFGQNCDPLAP